MRLSYTRLMIPLFVTALLLLRMFASSVIASENESSAPADCDIQKGVCIQALEGGNVTLDILPRPVTAMTDLTFRITLQNLVPAGDPYIDLDMPGMKMGPNRIPLRKTSEGLYTGSGVIVRCRSGRTLWQADITIPGVGKAAFSFNVVH